MLCPLSLKKSDELVMMLNVQKRQTRLFELVENRGPENLGLRQCCTKSSLVWLGCHAQPKAAILIFQDFLF